MKNNGWAAHGPAPVALGMTAQTGQILLLRELLMLFHGNELSMGIIFASWLFWVGVGSRLGVLLAERAVDARRLVRAAASGFLFVLPATLLGVRMARGLFPVLPGVYLSLSDMFLTCVAGMAPACLLIGILFVTLAKIWREDAGEGGPGYAGKTYIHEALGSVIGGLLYTFFLVRHVEALQAAVLAGLVLLASVRNLPRAPAGGPDHGRPGRLYYGALLLAGLAAFPLLGRLDHWAYRQQWRTMAPGHHLVALQNSRYGMISVLERAGQYSFFQSGHLVFSTAGEKGAAEVLEEQQGAILAHLALVQHPNPRRILLIGGGMAGTLREILRHPVQQVDYIELDEQLTAIAEQRLSPGTLAALHDPRTRLHHTDGRLFVKTMQDKYDMILVDVPDPNTALLNRYYTADFFREARARMPPDGVLCIGALSSGDLRGPEAHRNATLYHTLREVFRDVLPVGERHLFFFATQTGGRLSADPNLLRDRFLEREIEVDGFSHRHYATLLQEGPLRRINRILRWHGRSPDAHLHPPQPGPLFPPSLDAQRAAEKKLPPVNRRYFINTDLKPIAYYYSLLFWSARTRADRIGPLRWMVRARPWWLFAAAGIAFPVTLLLRKKRGRAAPRLALTLSVFAFGFSTMALQMALLFSFQSVYGFVYERVGMIVALFMAGLAGGAVLAQAIPGRMAARALVALQAVIALFCAGLALALPAVAALTSPAVIFVVFSLLTVLAGVFNGADYLPAAACAMKLDVRVDKAAGMVYGIELAGGALGAVAGALLFPVLGITACCLLAAVANGAACGALWSTRKAYG